MPLAHLENPWSEESPLYGTGIFGGNRNTNLFHDGWGFTLISSIVPHDGHEYAAETIIAGLTLLEICVSFEFCTL